MLGERSSVKSIHGLVAAAHPLAAQAGAQMLASGGNAFDAAVAVAAALGVVEPAMSGIAGMGMATCWIASEKRVKVLDFVGHAPFDFPADRFKSIRELNRGAPSCGSPANLAGWAELIAAHGKKSLGDALEAATALAHDGFPLGDYTADAIGRTAKEAVGKPLFDEWRRVYSQPAGTVLRQPDLARTLAMIASQGIDYFYNGPLGRALIECVMAEGGCLSPRDLAAIRPAWVAPLSADYRGVTVAVPPPPSEAFQYLLTLRILEGFDLTRHERGGVESVDMQWRAIRLAAGLRVQTQPSPENLAALFSDDTVFDLRQRVHQQGPIFGQTEQYPDPEPPDPLQDHTTSFSVADGAGNVICCTQTLGVSFGCGLVVPGTGICLNDLHYFGDVSSSGPNPLKPGKRLGLPIAPSLATRAGQPVLALGTPGGYGICQTQTQVLINYLDYGLSLQDAIDAPRARLWNGARVLVENRVSRETLDALQARGHDVEVADSWSIRVGGMHAIAIDPLTRVLIGGADPRRDGIVSAPIVPLGSLNEEASSIQADEAQQQ